MICKEEVGLGIGRGGWWWDAVDVVNWIREEMVRLMRVFVGL